MERSLYGAMRAALHPISSISAVPGGLSSAAPAALRKSAYSAAKQEAEQQIHSLQALFKLRHLHYSSLLKYTKSCFTETNRTVCPISSTELIPCKFLMVLFTRNTWLLV
jgi:hypothetical protein